MIRSISNLEPWVSLSKTRDNRVQTSSKSFRVNNDLLVFVADISTTIRCITETSVIDRLVSSNVEWFLAVVRRWGEYIYVPWRSWRQRVIRGESKERLVRFLVDVINSLFIIPLEILSQLQHCKSLHKVIKDIFVDLNFGVNSIARGAISFLHFKVRSTEQQPGKFHCQPHGFNFRRLRRGYCEGYHRRCRSYRVLPEGDYGCILLRVGERIQYETSCEFSSGAELGWPVLVVDCLCRLSVLGMITQLDVPLCFFWVKGRVAMKRDRKHTHKRTECSDYLSL